MDTLSLEVWTSTNTHSKTHTTKVLPAFTASIHRAAGCHKFSSQICSISFILWFPLNNLIWWWWWHCRLLHYHYLFGKFNKNWRFAEIYTSFFIAAMLVKLCALCTVNMQDTVMMVTELPLEILGYFLQMVDSWSQTDINIAVSNF